MRRALSTLVVVALVVLVACSGESVDDEGAAPTTAGGPSTFRSAGPLGPTTVAAAVRDVLATDAEPPGAPDAR